MIIATRQLENGEWECEGPMNLRGLGKTKEEARADLSRQLKEFCDEYERKHGHQLVFR